MVDALRWLTVVSIALAGASTSLAQNVSPAQSTSRAAFAIPPPTPAELALPRRGRALPLELGETKTVMGWGNMPYMGVGAPRHASAIIDSGFKGLEEWLADHPREQDQTTYVTEAADAPEEEREHGFLVYRVARLVQADAKILLYRVNSASSLLRAIDDAARKGAMVINVSQGFHYLFEIVEQDTHFIETLDKLLMSREIFVLFSAGNERDDIHAWISSDPDGNGYVDAFPPSSARNFNDAFRVVLQSGTNAFYFSWDTAHHPDADYELELTTPDGRHLANARVERDSKVKGLVILGHTADARKPALIRIRRLKGPASGVFMRLRAADIAVAEDFNGLQSMKTYGLHQNPFLIFVGGVGKTASGTIVPSAFSSIGTRPDGTRYPDILGPGQLVLDGREIRGTSFAAPFVTAIYGLSTGYNIKNIMARTSSHARLDPSVAAHERSQWGLPQAFKAVFGLKQVTGPTKIEDVSHRIEGDDLIVSFSVTRCCMEGMTWWVTANLFDTSSNTYLTNAETKNVAGGNVKLRSERADFVRHRTELKIPLKGLEAAKGKTVGLTFGIMVHAWRTAPRDLMTVDEAPAYRLVL